MLRWALVYKALVGAHSHPMMHGDQTRAESACDQRLLLVV
jgi:hypothetical protein